MLGQASLTERGKSKDGTPRLATSSRFPRIVIPSHEVGSYQRPYDDGVLYRSCRTRPITQICQESPLFSRQILRAGCFSP